MLQRATPSDLEAITRLVSSVRPEWQAHLVSSVLSSHAYNVDVADLAVAALRCARDLTLTDPRSIGWAARHWRDLATQPVKVEDKTKRCTTCGKTESRCLGERVHFPADDPRADPHPFVTTR